MAPFALKAAHNMATHSCLSRQQQEYKHYPRCGFFACKEGSIRNLVRSITMKEHSVLRRFLEWLFPSSRPQQTGHSILAGAHEAENVSDQNSLQSDACCCGPCARIRIYAIGDIHGRADLLRTLLGKVDADRKSRPVERTIVVFLGDYIDRGPSSKDVLDILLDYQVNFESVFLKGNHEKIALDFLKNHSVLKSWRSCGGLDTLVSYGLRPSFSSSADERLRLSRELSECMPAEHLNFLMSLRLYFKSGNFSLFTQVSDRGRSSKIKMRRTCFRFVMNFLSITSHSNFLLCMGIPPWARRTCGLIG